MATRPERVLIAVERSTASEEAVEYAAAALARLPAVQVYVVHVVGPLPPDLRSRPGETPTDEGRDAQAAWMATAREEAKALLADVEQRLRTAGMAPGTVAARVAELGAGDDVASCLLASARELECDTVVLGREAISWVPHFVYPHVAEAVVRAAKGITVWVVG